MRFWSLLSVSALLMGICKAHTVHLGRTCPEIEAFPNLSINKILGIWFVVYQFDTANTCMVWNITKSDRSSDELLLTESRQINLLDAIGVDHKHSLTAKLNITNPEVPSKMRIRWPTSLTGNADFIVFDTDYDKYLAVFQCDRAGIIHRRDVTLLSREPIVSNLFVKRVRRILDSFEVPHGYLRAISHRDCKKSPSRDWHIDEELFGFLSKKDNYREILAKDIHDYDLSEIEILSDGVEAVNSNFQGSMKEQPKPSV